MSRPFRAPLLRVLIIALTTSAFAAERYQVEYQGNKRTVYFYAPKSLTAASPLLLLLHGSGRNGEIMIEQWKKLADREGIVLVAPDAKNPMQWTITEDVDSPGFLRTVVEDAARRALVDKRRLYVFGHSAGAVYGLILPLMQPEYFAAVAVHAGALTPDVLDQLGVLAEQRKTPVHMQVGTRDVFFPLVDVRRTHAAFQKAGMDVELVEIPNHDHNYYVISDKVNAAAWEFLKNKRLPTEPRFLEAGTQP